MQRKITKLESVLLENGWYLAIKRYKGKHSEKIECYEYHKTSDLRNDGRTFELVIKLDQKRSQIVDYGVKNVYLHYLNDQELCFVRFLFLELRHFVERTIKQLEKDCPQNNVVVPSDDLIEKPGITPMTPEQLDELCQEKEKGE